MEGKPRRGQQRTRWLDGFSDSMNISLSKFQDIGKHRKASLLPLTGLQNVRLSDWTTRTMHVLDLLHKVSSPLHLWYTGELAPFQLESQDYLSTSLRLSWSLCTQGQWENLPSGWMWGLSVSFLESWQVLSWHLAPWKNLLEGLWLYLVIMFLLPSRKSLSQLSLAFDLGPNWFPFARWVVRVALSWVSESRGPWEWSIVPQVLGWGWLGSFILEIYRKALKLQALF